MQLVHMDVSLPGQNSRQVVGPLSSGLNGLYGPRGSGKSRLIRWLRQVTADTYGHDYIPGAFVPGSSHIDLGKLDMLGDVELRNHGLPLRISRDSYGRVTTNRPASDHRRDSHNGHSNAQLNGYRTHVAGGSQDLTPRQRHAFALLADATGLTDTEVALDDVARQLGLETRMDETRLGERDLLVTRQRDLMTRLDLLQRLPASREDLVARRRDIEHKLESLRSLWGRDGNDWHLDRNRLLDRCAAIEADLNGAEAEIQQIDAEIAKAKAELKHSEIGQQTVDIEPSYRQQLQQLEDRLTRWRKTLRDLKVHRESIENDETEAHLDQQVGTQLSGNLHADPRASMRSLEAQLHHARKQLDQLIGQYWPTAPTSGQAATGPSPSLDRIDRPLSGSGYIDPRSVDPRFVDPRYVDPRYVDPRHVDPRTLDPRVLASGYQVQRDALGRTHITYDTAATAAFDTAQLPEMLRSMQRDLHDVCHQLSRQEAANASVALKQQAQQLRRCETELLQSVEKLIDERGSLLRKIADRYNLSSEQLSLTFGEWCQCSDHPHLYDWLLQDEAPRKATREVDGELRSRLEESLSRLNSQRREAALRAEECRRQLRDANRIRVSTHSQKQVENRQAEEAELLRELDLIIRQLSDWESRDRLVAELDEVRRLLSRTPVAVTSGSEFRSAVDQNVVHLSGSLYTRTPLTDAEYTTSRQYDTVNGVVFEQPAMRQRYEVPGAIVRTAQRLSIGQLLAARGDTIPVVLDQTLDGLNPRLQQAAIAYLALAANRLQILVLTDDAHVSDLIKQHGGNVVLLQDAPIARQDKDVNRLLIGFANDEEAAKWYQPTFDPLPRSRTSREYYLTESSAIEQHPGIDVRMGEFCRAVGIARIGDLLDVDPVWLANNLRISNVDANRVSNWQAVADLLCSVRNLRPFDARVLVGSGIRSASQLSAMNPNQLFDDVESFLATDVGRKILSTGNSFEHSRIRNWISAARNNTGRFQSANRPKRYEHDRDRVNRELADRHLDAVDDRDYSHRPHNALHAERDLPIYDQPNGSRPSRTDHSSNARRPTRSDRPQRVDRPISAQRAQRVERDFPNVVDADRRRAAEPKAVQRVARTANANGSAAVKFYLDLASPVVDAPSIGDRMAERMNAVGVHTVEQLLAGNADSLANKLANRKVTGQTIRTWQDQARLVCRIPFLRGHDAQLLVACGVTSPETLRGLSADAVLSKVLAFAKSSEGQRILRGSKEPDLAEVHDWINWSSQSRSLNAA